MKNKIIFLVAFTLLSNLSSLMAVCFIIRVPHNFFYMSGSERTVSVGQYQYAIADKNYGDIRVFYIPKDILKKYIHHETKTLNIIPDDVLKQYSPISSRIVKFKRT